MAAELTALIRMHNDHLLGLPRPDRRDTEEAEAVLIAEKNRIWRVAVLGEVKRYTLDEAAAHYTNTKTNAGRFRWEANFLPKRVVQEYAPP